MADYATVAELKSFLRIPDDDTTDDTELAFALTTASQLIDKATNRTFDLSSAYTDDRYYTPFYDPKLRRYVITVDDISDTTGLAFEIESTEGTFDTVVTGLYRMYPYNAPSFNIPYTHVIFAPGAIPGNGDVLTTARFGWAAVPTTIKQATLLQSARIFKRRDAPFGVAGSPDLGNELRLLAKLDPDVEVMVNRFKRWWSAV